MNTARILGAILAIACAWWFGRSVRLLTSQRHARRAGR